MVDVSETIAPNSEQVNAEDLIGGPKQVTVTGVRSGTADQPVFIDLAEFPGRTYRPAKSMRRVLVAAWGSDSSNYVGRQMVLFNDPNVKWAGQEVGGIRIRSMSHISTAVRVNLTVTRGKREPFVVEPLISQVDESAVADWVAAMECAVDLNDLQSAWAAAGESGVTRDPRVIAAKDARKKVLSEADQV